MHRFGFLLLGALVGANPATAQLIDFETLPDSTVTTDTLAISDQYASLGVLFSLVDPVTGDPVGSPRIAKAGSPRTAFDACYGDDTPRPGQELGVSFLTDDTSLGVSAALHVTYTTKVSQASGVLIDVDCRQPAGNPPCEQWTIVAFDSVSATLETVILDAPLGGSNPDCPSPNGQGDARAFGWAFDRASADIASIRFTYTGAAPDVGLAFDNFSPATLGLPPSVSIVAEADSVCPGEPVTLNAEVTGGLPAFTYQWQRETGPGVWTDLGTGETQVISPSTDESVRVIVTDALDRQATSPVRDLFVLSSGEPMCGWWLMVSGYHTDSVEQYGGVIGGYRRTLVSSGSGGLNGASGLTCGPDGNLYVSSQEDDSVRRYDGATGAPINVFVPSGSGGLSTPTELVFGADGNLLVSSAGNSRVLRYDGTTGAFIDAFVTSGSGGLAGPTGTIIGPDGDLYVASNANDRVLRYDGTSGAFIETFVSAGSGGLDAPRGLIFGPDGDLYVGEQVNDRVLRFDGMDGTFVEVFVSAGAGGLDRANDVLFDPRGDLLVASFEGHQVLRYDGLTGAFLGVFAEVNGPAWLAFSCDPSPTAAPNAPPTSSPVELSVVGSHGSRGPVSFRIFLPAAMPLTLSVHDVAGRRIRELAEGPRAAGTHEIVWDFTAPDGGELASGVYFARLEAGGTVLTKKVVRVR